MADFFVVLLITLVLICISAVFLQWITHRNEVLARERIQASVPAAVVRENRLKRFNLLEKDSHGGQGDLKSVHFVETQTEVTKTEKSALNVSRKDEMVIQQVSVKQGTSSGEQSGTNLVGKLEKAEKSGDSFETKYQLGNVGAVHDDGGKTKTDLLKRESSRRLVTLRQATVEDMNGIPVTNPLKSLEELKNWNMGFDEFNVSSRALHDRALASDLENHRRTLVCHDMKGGYLEDRFVQGFPSSDCYSFYHWQYIDIFVYFSHNFITIPPPSWTNAAHKHGVKVLGTFITEWEDGARRCAEMFADEISYLTVADQLVSMAKYYKFDGWLVNIENPIQPAQINNLEQFLSCLTREMHKKVPGSLVIWYDSVTYNGDLKWQNELNPDNRIFFDASDGIFLNYGWNERNLTMSARAAGQERRYDVYVGVDVFGRDCFGGGGWNTNKATSVIKNRDLSTALFAPGWVYENYQTSFKVSQDKFWTSIAPDCTINTLESQLPFVTSFCQGYGDRVYRCGKVIYDQAWSHVGAQQVQPSYSNHIYSLGGQDEMSITLMEHSCKDAFNGGGCLVFQGFTKPSSASAKVVVRLFKTNILLPGTIVISFTTKLEANANLDVALQLHTDTKPTYIMLCSPQPNQHLHEDKDHMNDSLNEALLQRYGVTRSSQLNSDHLAIAIGQEHYRLFAPVTADQYAKMQSLCCDNTGTGNGWCTRYYLLAEKDLRNAHIKEIRLVLINKSSQDSQHKDNSSEFKLFLGEVKILDAVSLRRPVPMATHLHCREHEIMVQQDTPNSNMITLSLTLSWSYESNTPYERFAIYCIGADGTTKFLGLAFVLSFFVSQLSVPKLQKDVKFLVQAVDTCQRKQCLEKCPMITVQWT